jgi:hypothetical protein
MRQHINIRRMQAAIQKNEHRIVNTVSPINLVVSTPGASQSWYQQRRKKLFILICSLLIPRELLQAY